MSSRLTLSNRQENLKLLLEFVGKWAQERGLSASRQASLKGVTGEIFRHLVTHAYRPEQPGSITVVLEEKGPRLRLIFEDDAAPHNPLQPDKPTTPQGTSSAEGTPPLRRVQQMADSLIYYRTPDRKNRLVVFLTL
ncbi:MAG: ATP-binding protein [Desulfobaccales bacterium]|nr:ATP-binding protein [Desulfobaccales bacterium]